LLEWLLSCYLATLIILVAIPLALLGGGNVPTPPKRERATKVFLTLRGGAIYSLGRYLRRFRTEDRARLIDLLRSQLAAVFTSM
jgi:hypothetical protein